MNLSFVCLLSFFFFCIANGEPEYYESLDLQPLTPPSLLASFRFRGNTSLQSYEQQHFRYIPRSLGQILQHAKTRELHLRFSTGRWDDESWGARPWNGTKEGGTGVELWAWVEADSDEASFARWTTLNHALSGLFCASLNFVDSTRTTRPRMSFQPTGDHRTSASGEKLYLLHGTLPREVVCTENLTPFLKLLPCKGKAGIASLLDGHKLFDASWQSMAIDVRQVCPLGQACSIEMEQSIDMVLDTERSKRPRDNPIPRPVPNEALLCDSTRNYSNPDSCFPSDISRGQSWTVAEIFGRRLQGACLASNGSESLCLHVPHEREVHPSFGEGNYKYSPSGSDVRCFVLPTHESFDMTLSHIGPQTFNPHTAPPLYASRSITGYGQERGGIQALLTNPSPSSPITFVYFESLPWFMKPYLHTLTARLSTSSKPSGPGSLIKETFYRPALDRKRGTQLELLLTVPANSTVILTYDFDKAILRYTEYPPDANRGFDVAPAVIRVLNSGSSLMTSNGSAPATQVADDTVYYMRTTSLLLPLPTPDFSMPYNVIILTSTVMALAFGSIFNFLVRRFVMAEEVEGYDVGSLKGKIRARVAALRARVVSLFAGKGKGTDEAQLKKDQ